jgi:hypothetical protein
MRNSHIREQYVPHDNILAFCDKRQDWLCCRVYEQFVNEVRDLISLRIAEGGNDNIWDCLTIGLSGLPYLKMHVRNFSLTDGSFSPNLFLGRRFKLLGKLVIQW